MSILLAAVQTVAATPTPSLSPSPSVTPVIQTVIQTVQVEPAWVKPLVDFLRQVAALAIFVVPTWLASWIHQLVNLSKDGSKRFSQWQSIFLLWAYSVVISLAGLVAVASLDLVHINWADPYVVGGAFLTVLGAASARYNRMQLKGTDTTSATPQIV